MIRKLVFSILIFFFLVPSFIEAKKISAEDLPQQYRKWLEEEVTYVIGPKERDIFLQLETDREREIFIEAFWKQRDPTPGTPENEFRNEHYRRVAYANKFFGRETTRPGWKTDRGRIYIILGDPIDIDRYEDSASNYPVEVWFYQGDVQYGLPSHFNVAFFKRRGAGEYILYSPVNDGPQQILKNYYGDPTDYEAAYEKLKEYDVLLANVSLTLIPGERPVIGHPSLTSEIMIGNVINLPQKKIDQVYAEKLLRYKDIVEVEYTANYVASDSLVTIIRDSSGISFVHFSVDPKTISVGSSEDKYYSYFELAVHVADREGKTIFQYQKSYPLNFDKEQLMDIKLKSYSIQDVFPLASGSYKLSVLLKNTVSKEFTSFEADISIPDITSFQVTPLLFGYKIEENPAFDRFIKPFRVGNIQLFCQPSKLFIQKEELVVFFQIYGLSQDFIEEGSINYSFYREDEKFMTETVSLNENRDKIAYLKNFPLQNFPPGYYTLKVGLVDKEQKEILSEKDEFSITHLGAIARPWVISKATPLSSKIEYSFILGNQLFNKGEIGQAKSVLESIYRQNPVSLKFAHAFSRVLFALKEYQKLKEVLKPFSESPQENYEFLSLLGKSCQALGEYEEAIQYYKQHLAHLGTNITILNSIGECYHLLGKDEEALVAWEKSLEIEPNQEEIKEKVKSITEKRK